MALRLAQTAAGVLMIQESGEFASALAAVDAPRFWASIQCFVDVLVVAVPLYAFYDYVRDAAVRHVRKAISQVDGLQAADPQVGSVRLTLAEAEARAGRHGRTITQVSSWLRETSPVEWSTLLQDGLRRAGMPEQRLSRLW